MTFSLMRFSLMTFRPGANLDQSQVKDLRYDRRSETTGTPRKQPTVNVKSGGRRAVPPLRGPKRRAS